MNNKTSKPNKHTSKHAYTSLYYIALLFTIVIGFIIHELPPVITTATPTTTTTTITAYSKRMVSLQSLKINMALIIKPYQGLIRPEKAL